MKRLLYLTIFLALGIWFCSCGSSKNMETQKQVNYSGEFSRVMSAIESLKADVSKQTKITTDKLSNLKVENKTVILSPPDSTGRQYPMQESTTIASKNEKENKRMEETIMFTIQQLTTLVDSLSNKVDILLKQKEEVVKLSWWDLHKEKVYCGIIGLLLVGVVVYGWRRN